MSDISRIYRTINSDSFPSKMEIALYDDHANRQTLFYEKVVWNIDGEVKGLRYGENPDQPAALYRLINGNLTLGEVTSLQPGRYLSSDIELLQSGKHPGKTNITDVDNALNILRYFSDTPATVIVKHNNPCGAAKGASLLESYTKALLADRVAAFGGAVSVNRELDRETAEAICESYCEVVAAPEFAPGVMDLFAEKKNLRVMRIKNIERLNDFVGQRFLDFKSLMDGGLVTQWSFVPKRDPSLFLPARCEYKGRLYEVQRKPTPAEMDDLLFGWLVESGITSNSVIFVKDGATVGIGTGEQDRVGVAEIARDKAYRKLADRLSWAKYATPWNLLDDQEKRKEIETAVSETNGGLKGSVMISDAFFPFRDGIDVGLREGVSAVIQPGGSVRDYEVIEACNQFNASMVFTGQRSFKH